VRGSVRAVNPATGQPFERNPYRAGPEQITELGGTGGLAFFSLDLRLSKIIKFGGDKSIEVLGEVFNVSNHTNFDRDTYVNIFTSPDFGRARSIVRNSNRQAEFGVRFRF